MSTNKDDYGKAVEQAAELMAQLAVAAIEEQAAKRKKKSTKIAKEVEDTLKINKS